MNNAGQSDRLRALETAVREFRDAWNIYEDTEAFDRLHHLERVRDARRALFALVAT